MQRLLRKFDTAKTLVPRPMHQRGEAGARYGVIYYGSTSPAMDEALDALEAAASARRACACAPSRSTSVRDFIAEHDFVFVVEQNRDAQLRSCWSTRIRHRPGAAGAGPALRRHADHRALHRERDRASASAAAARRAAQGRQMSCPMHAWPTPRDLPRQAQAPPPRS
jgi:hypothetical protein